MSPRVENRSAESRVAAMFSNWKLSECGGALRESCRYRSIARSGLDGESPALCARWLRCLLRRGQRDAVKARGLSNWKPKSLGFSPITAAETMKKT